MQKLRSTRQTWIWLALLLIVFMLTSYFFLSQAPKQYPNYVSDSPSPTGVKAFYTYLQQEEEVERWTHSPNLLRNTTKNQILIMIEPFFMPNSEEMADYESFMEAGNTILLLKKNPQEMFDLQVEMVEQTDESLKVYAQEGTSYHAKLSSPFRLQTKNNSEILLKDEGGTIALKQHFGKGQLIVAVAPEWVINSNIVKHDHIPLIFSFLPEENGQLFLFDEYIHKGQNAPAVVTLYPQWFLLMLLQGCILIILLLLYRGKRFGPIYIPREETVRFSDEGIKAIAAWFIRGKRYQDSLIIQVEYIKSIMQERWGLPVKSDWKIISAFVERKLTWQNPMEIQTFINELKNVLEKDKLSKHEYLLWSKKLDRLRKEVEEG
ncbi:DUF4350 domain-containing protein [Bacillus sp. Bva_UNVM-123]|uniref:DUF4350 domain-containing protein n=1 Tax=Bacillus sp. Bva_UNVM-123 TaxID=2829798 RepID=UPI00391F45B7